MHVLWHIEVYVKESISASFVSDAEVLTLPTLTHAAKGKLQHTAKLSARPDTGDHFCVTGVIWHGQPSGEAGAGAGSGVAAGLGPGRSSGAHGGLGKARTRGAREEDSEDDGLMMPLLQVCPSSVIWRLGCLDLTSSYAST